MKVGNRLKIVGIVVAFLMNCALHSADNGAGLPGKASAATGLPGGALAATGAGDSTGKLVRVLKEAGMGAVWDLFKSFKGAGPGPETAAAQTREAPAAVIASLARARAHNVDRKEGKEGKRSDGN